jgi:hypothetical protein
MRFTENAPSTAFGSIPISRPKLALPDLTAFSVALPMRPGRGVADFAAFQEAPLVAPSFLRRSPSSVGRFDDWG